MLIDLGIVNYASLDPESTTFGRFIGPRRHVAGRFGTFCRLARVKAKGGCSVQWLNRVESDIAARKKAALKARSLMQCGRCHYQSSVTAGTIFHANKLALSVGF